MRLELERNFMQVSGFLNDPQARIGLTECMDALQDMEAIWPLASWAHELLLKQDSFGQLVTR